ncbi:phytolongin Phyl1.1-like [Salvia miltiorrhiza]|uniref:phytolongin Phyl1.1-like n=1 Tax=Salvia miltiorrhiza TaxID=226208 RepID=UPI0025AD221E|nr:phytolongin Phyl1.1-like [Salvia miltiorrhiza]
MSVATAANPANICAMDRVSYCCVWKEGRVIYKYSVGNHEIDNMAALCLESIPPYHRSYSQTIASYTFSFLIDDAFVYFAILRRHSLTNSHLLAFLQSLRDEFTNIATPKTLDDHFAPVVRRLVASLEAATATPWPAMNGAAAEAGTSTKAPLLARPCKQDKKKKIKDDAAVARDIETPEHRRSTDSDASSRIKSSTQNLRDKWCRQVRIVLAIDAAVCLLLLVIWLVICHGIECIR